MTTSTFSDANRVQRRTTQQQKLAVAIALVGMVAVSAATLGHIGPVSAPTSPNLSEQTRTHQPAPEFVQKWGQPY